VALLNDDSNPVSRVHLGLVFLVEPEPGTRVAVRETDKLEGEALPLEAMRRHYLNMESWSQLAYDDLVGGARDRAAHSPLVVDLAAAP
jgi:predicted NUDIX family phosphoesterase